MRLVYYELTRLVDDLNKCNDVLIKRQILNDIDFLKEALILSEHPLTFLCENSIPPIQRVQDVQVRIRDCIARIRSVDAC